MIKSIWTVNFRDPIIGTIVNAMPAYLHLEEVHRFGHLLRGVIVRVFYPHHPEPLHEPLRHDRHRVNRVCTSLT